MYRLTDSAIDMFLFPDHGYIKKILYHDFSFSTSDHFIMLLENYVLKTITIVLDKALPGCRDFMFPR